MSQNNISYYTREELERTAPGGVILQTYKREAKCGGTITKISYKYCAHPAFNLLNFLPMFLIVNTYDVFAPCDVIFFDSNSGENIGETETEAAKNCSKKAEKYAEENNFEKAADYFNRAYLVCLSNDSDEGFYQKMKDCMTKAATAKNLFEQEKYSEAEFAYNEAIQLCRMSGVVSNMKRLRERCSDAGKKEKINLLIFRGKAEAMKGNFQAANELFEQVVDNCNDYNYRCMNKSTEIATKAMNLYQTGKYEEAKAKFNEAIEASTDSELQSAYSKFHGEAVAKQYEMGVTKYSEAKKYYELAWKQENDENADEAEKLFLLARNFIQEALALNPTKSLYNQFNSLICLKIEGNDHFNEGLKYQNWGNKILEEIEMHCVVDVRDSFNKAFEYFSKADECFTIGANDDKHFAECQKIVKINLDTVQNELKKINTGLQNQLLTNFSINLKN